MNQWIKINNVNYPIISCFGLKEENLGSVRECIEITLEMSYEEAVKLFVDNMEYYIVQEDKYFIDKDQETIDTQEYDQSMYSLSGDIIDHRDGTCTIVMGAPTETEELLMQLYNED